MVVVSQTWTDVHRINANIRNALKAKGLIGPHDSVVQALDKLDLTNAQIRDGPFCPPEASLFSIKRWLIGSQRRKASLLALCVLIALLIYWAFTAPTNLLGRLTG